MPYKRVRKRTFVGEFYYFYRVDSQCVVSIFGSWQAI